MSVFLDTAVVVAVHNERDGNHERAVAVLEAVREGEHGNAFSSDFVLDESVTLAWVRTKDRRVAKAVGHFFLPPEGGAGRARGMGLVPAARSPVEFPGLDDRGTGPSSRYRPRGYVRRQTSPL